MIAGTYNILCEQGSTFSRTIALEQPTFNDPTIYEVYPLIGHTARMQVRRTLESSTAMIELTTENGRIDISAEDGVINIMMTAEETAALTSSGVYDLEIIDAADNVSRVIQGIFTLSLEVTR